MRKSTLALGISAAFAAQAFLDPTASAAQGIRAQAGHTNRPSSLKAPAGSTILYDQSGTVANGAPSQNFESSFDGYDSASADDFVVTDANGWDISQFNFAVSATSDPSSATYDINIYNDDSGLPGTLTSCTYSALPGTLTAGNTALSVALPSACHLDPGTYWVSEVANLDYGVGGQLFWSDVDPSIAAVNSPAAFENPLDGFGSGCTSWSPFASCGGTATSTSPVGGGSNNLIFQVMGAVSGGGGGSCTSGGICLEVTLAEANGDPNQCGTTDTLDASVGDQVNFCYTVTNDSGIELDYQSLMDNVDGTIFSLMNVPIADGASYQYNRIVTAGSDETVTSTWTSQDVPPGYSATPTTGGGGITDRIFCDGFDGTPCDNGGGGFIDITSTGTALGLSDDATQGVTMPFSFNFYGQTSSDICIGNNGGAIFGVSTCSLTFTNASLPDPGLGAAILPLWDDFDAESGDVYYATRGSAPNRQFIVEWFNRVHFNGTANTDGATFELILNEADGTIQFEYDDVDYTGFTNASGDPDDCTGGVCATIGLQQDDSQANQYSFNTASVTSGSGIDWAPTTPQIFTDTDTVMLNVGAPIIDVSPNPLNGTAPAGGTNTTTLNIGNTGDRDLNWNTEEAPPASHFPPLGPRFATPFGDPSKSTTRAAPAGMFHAGNRKSPYVYGPAPAGQTVPTFAVDVYNANTVNFDAAAPSTVNVIAPNDYSLYAGDFVDGDFSKLYAFDGSSTSAHFNEFVSVDTTSGAITDIANAPPTVAGETWSGLSWDSTTSTLYGSGTACGASSSIYTINPTTGAATLVGTNTAPCLIDIAMSPSGLLYGLDIVNDALYAIDKTNGNATLIGSIGFNANYAQGMDFDDSTGILYLAGLDAGNLTDNIYTVDTDTGAATLESQIGSALGEIDAMGIATGGGPCTQPQDLPWLSLSPTSGTTVPGGSDPVTVTFDATGQTDGDVLDGTICVNSNDPNNRTVAVPVELTVGMGGGGGGIVDSGPLDISVNPDFTGLYINWLTGCTEDSNGGSCAEGTDFNAYDTSGLGFFFPSINSGNCLSTDSTSCDSLTTGDTIGSGSTFAASNSDNFLSVGTHYMGFSFTNADTGMTNYGYVKLTVDSGGTDPGFPITLNEYFYDNTGADITIAP